MIPFLFVPMSRKKKHRSKKKKSHAKSPAGGFFD